MITTFTSSQLVTLHDAKPVTTSLAIAEHFGKQHFNVLRAIRDRLESVPDETVCPEDAKKINRFNELNFEGTDYIDKNGDVQPAYEITEDGFAFVVMGFTGSKADLWKIKFIEAFRMLRKQAQDQLEAHHRQLLADKDAKIQHQNEIAHEMFKIVGNPYTVRDRHAEVLAKERATTERKKDHANNVAIKVEREQRRFWVPRLERFAKVYNQLLEAAKAAANKKATKPDLNLILTSHPVNTSQEIMELVNMD